MENQLPVPPQVPLAPVANLPPKTNNYKFLIIGIVAAFVLLLSLGLAVVFIARQVRTTSPTPTPSFETPQPASFEEEIKNPSRYATDSGVLKTQADLNALDKDLNSVDLNENSLRPPDVQFDESF